MVVSISLYVITLVILFNGVRKKTQKLKNSDIDKAVKLKNEYYDQVSVIHERWLFIRESELATNQANLYKREIALKHPFNNSFFAADTLFNIDIADSIKSMGILKENVYVYMSYNVSTYLYFICLCI